jgi:hypothetical protein
MLLDWTGRAIREDKRGAIPDNLAPLLDRLGLDQSNWVKTVLEFGRMFKQAAGRASSLGACGAGVLATLVSGKGGCSSCLSLGKRFDAAAPAI